MESSNNPEGYCYSSIDQLPSLTTTIISEKNPGTDNSFYRAPLRHHQEMMLEDDKIEANDGKISEHETLHTHGLDKYGQRKSICHNFFRSHSIGNRNSMLAASTNITMNRSTSPPSLYPTITERTVDDELASSAQSSLSLPSCTSNDTSAEFPTHANTDTTLSKMSSFYQAALKEVAEIEENDEDIQLQKKKQQCDVPLEEARASNAGLDSYHLRTISTPSTTNNGCGNSKNNEILISTSTPKSSFYRAALEDAKCVEEEESFILQHYEYNRNQHNQYAMNIVDYSISNKEVNNTMHIPSPFYRSALKEAMLAEQELGVQDEIKDDNVAIAGTSEVASSIPIQSAAIEVQGPELRSDFVIDPNIMVHEENGDNNRIGRSRISSISSSSISSHFNAPSTTGVDSPQILVRTRSNDSDPFRLQRRLSTASSLPSTVIAVERDGIAPHQRSPSFVDGSCAFSVTRSSVKACMPNSVLSTKQAEAGTQATRTDTHLFMRKEAFRNSQHFNCSRSLSRDSEDDENNEDLLLAIYLSRFESSATASLKSEGTSSNSLSTGGSHCASEEKSNRNHYYDQMLTSCSDTEKKSEFLISQFEAMEECRKKNCVVYSSNQSSDKSRRSSSLMSSDETVFGSSRDTTTCLSSNPSERKESRSRSLLENRGAKETRQAISNGNSCVVRCKGCKGRLQAPVHYSLVYCPKCQTISPA